MQKSFIKTAAVLGALSVILGAFGAHALKQWVKDDVINIFETGVRYQFYHVFALFAAGIIYKDFPNNLLRWAGIFFVSGVFLFSGSLYFLTYVKASQVQGYNWVGILTPIGGLSFILGWVCLFAGMFRNK